MGLKNIFNKKSAASQLRAQSSPNDPLDSPSTLQSTTVPKDSSINSSLKTETERSNSIIPASATTTKASDSSSPAMSRQNSLTSSSSSSLVPAHPQVSPMNGVSSSEANVLSRLTVYPDGSHTHQLKNARRQEKLGRMLREIMGMGPKVGNDAVSAVPDFVKQTDRLTLMHGLVNRLANGEVEVGRVSGASHQPKRLSTNFEHGGTAIKEATAKSLAEKYGRCQEIIGRGSYGTVRVSHKTSSSGQEQLYAVKEFRKRSTESSTVYQDRLMSEFCISSSLDHINIIHTFDLMKDTHGSCCQIMEYCSGGDLYSLIISSGSGLTAIESDCFFKQILRGVVYMHSMGVAHCDLKPENILLTQNGVCKISDFGNGECFRMAWEKDVHYSKGVFGSGPYIAPEEFKGKSFDPRAVDIWALGIIYMVMRTGSYLWRKAVADEDDHYAKYIRDRKTAKGYSPVEKLTPSKSVYVIYSILDPVPSRRITGKQILNSEWGRSIRVCECAEPKDKPAPTHACSPVPTPQSSQSTLATEKVNPELVTHHRAQQV